MNSGLVPCSATRLVRDLVDVTDGISNIDLTPLSALWDPDTCPASLLPWLAWALSVDHWDSNWTDAQKRAVINASLDAHRRKGTIGALRMALAALNLDLTVVEWFDENPQADPYTFSIDVMLNGQSMSLADQNNIADIVTATKNARSHLSMLHLNQSLQSAVPVVASAVATSQHVTLG